MTDVSLFIGPESDHCLLLSVTDSLTHSLLFSKLDCEDANSKLVEFFTVADVDEKRFDGSFMQFWKFGHKATFCSDFEHKVWPRV